MPAFVKTPAQEAAWERAKAVVKKQYPDIGEDSDRYYALVNSIYQNMKSLYKSTMCPAPLLRAAVKCLGSVPLAKRAGLVPRVAGVVQRCVDQLAKTRVVLTLAKAHVDGYWRTAPSGQRVWVEGYDSRRASASSSATHASASPPPPSHPQKERWDGMTRRELEETHQEHVQRAQNVNAKLPLLQQRTQREYWQQSADSLAQYMKERWPQREPPGTPPTPPPPPTGTRAIVTDTATAERMTQAQQVRARAERQRVARGHTDAELTARIQGLEAQGHHRDVNRQRLTEPQRIWLSLVQEQQRREAGG